MDEINAFIMDNFTIIIVIAVILIMTIIGYIAKRTGFGDRFSAYNRKNKKTNDEDIETLSDSTENLTNNITDAEKLDALDTIAPNFNDGGLVIGDVNQNPAVTNQELGISEDLYAPFGDNAKEELSLEDIKIEDVEEKDDFNIIEKDNKNDEVSDELIIEEVNPIVNEENNSNIDDIKIEEVDTLDNANTNVEEADKLDPVVEEINNLVDNTFVINDGTADFDNAKVETEPIEKKQDDIDVGLSKVEQFDIGESELTNEENNDFEIETTTNLKLDEINEKIKNLKLEDLDNQNLDAGLLEDLKKPKKKKNVSVKSVDEIKKSSSKKKNKDIDVITDLPLPNLSEVGDDEDVSEADDIWNF